MEVNYELTVEDFRRFNDYVVGSVPSFLVRRVLRYCYVPVAFAFICWILRVSLMAVLPWFLASIPVGIVLIYWSSRQSAYQRAKSVPGFLGLKTLRLGPDGIHSQAEIGGGVLKWQGITNIVDRPQDIYFMLDRRFGLVVPKRGFGSPALVEAFYQSAVSSWQGAEVEGNEDGTEPDIVWPPPPRIGG